MTFKWSNLGQLTREMTLNQESVTSMLGSEAFFLLPSTAVQGLQICIDLNAAFRVLDGNSFCTDDRVVL